MADCASDCASDMPTIRRGCRNPSAPPAPPPVAACDDHADAALLVRRAERQPVWVGLGCPRGGIKQVALRVLPNCNEPAAASRVIRSGCGCRGTAGLAHVNSGRWPRRPSPRISPTVTVGCMTCKLPFTGQMTIEMAFAELERISTLPPDDLGAVMFGLRTFDARRQRDWSGCHGSRDLGRAEQLGRQLQPRVIRVFGPDGF